MIRLSCLLALFGLLAVSQTGHAAGMFQPSVIVGQPATPHIVQQPVAPPVVINVPDPTAAVLSGCPDKCCPTPCITYRSRGERRSCLDDQPSVSLVVAVKNPQTGCVAMVPICIPACCLDEPCIDSRCGLFQRGIVNYEYKCGFRISFVFDRAGDLLVTYHY